MVGEDTLSHFAIQPLNLLRLQERKHGSTKGRVRHENIDAYFNARVEKLRELYEECYPETVRVWVMPAGETDGRKAVSVEKVVGEDISPFDLKDFDKRMPNVEDYFDEEEGRELIRLRKIE